MSADLWKDGSEGEGGGELSRYNITTRQNCHEKTHGKYENCMKC